MRGREPLVGGCVANVRCSLRLPAVRACGKLRKRQRERRVHAKADLASQASAAGEIRRLRAPTREPE